MQFHNLHLQVDLLGEALTDHANSPETLVVEVAQEITVLGVREASQL